MKTHRAKLSVALAVAVTLAVSACATPASTTGATSGEPVSGGTLRYALDLEPDTLDPQLSGRDITQLVLSNVVDSLVSQKSDGTFEPWLASEYTISEDGKTYTFTLRDDVTFHDGTPLTAEVVKENFDRILDPANAIQGASTAVGPLESVAVDGEKVVFTLATPYAPFLAKLATSQLGIISGAQVTEDPTSIAASGPIGSGPFTIGEYKKGTSLSLEKFDDYAWAPASAANAGAAYLDGVELRFLPEAAVRVGTVTSNQSDIAQSVPANLIEQLEDNSAVKLIDDADTGLNFTAYINTQQAPTNELEVRQALLHAVNVAEITESLYKGRFDAPKTIVSENTLGYSDESAAFAYDQKQANDLLDQAGWTERDSDDYRTKNGERLTIVWPTVSDDNERDQRGTYYALIQSAAKEVGIDIQLKAITFADIVAALAPDAYNVHALSQKTPDPDELNSFFNSGSDLNTGGTNISLYKNAQVDEWLNTARASSDPAERQKLYEQIQGQILADAAALPLYSHRYIAAARTPVDGLEYSAASYLVLQGVWIAP